MTQTLGKPNRQLRRFAAAWPDARWAIEGAASLGAPLTERLRDDQIAVTDVPAKLARRVRLLSTGHDRKSDKADAVDRYHGVVSPVLLDNSMCLLGRL